MPITEQAVTRKRSAIIKRRFALTHNFNAHHDLLLAYHDTGQLVLAFEELQAAVRLSPDSDSIANLKSILFDALGGISNAPALQEIISQLPEDAPDCPTLLGLRAS